MQKVTLTPNGVGEDIFPSVLLKVNGIVTRALIDTGAGSSYVSAKVGSLLKTKPSDLICLYCLYVYRLTWGNYRVLNKQGKCVGFAKYGAK